MKTWNKPSDKPLVSQRVLIADEEGNIDLGEYYSKYKEFDTRFEIPIIAWMSLPDFPEDMRRDYLRKKEENAY